MARGDNVKAVQCYMNDTGASEQVAREYIEGLVHETWKTLNKNIMSIGSSSNYPFTEPFITANPNLARTAQCFYQHGDGHGSPDGLTNHYHNSLLLHPFHLPSTNY